MNLKTRLIEKKAHWSVCIGTIYTSDVVVVNNNEKNETFEYFTKAIATMEKEKEIDIKKYALYKNCLAFCYFYGCGTDINYEKAFKLYEFAAKNGCIHAMFDLYDCYRRGFGTKEDKEKSLEWLLKAAENGDRLSIIEVANYYQNYQNNLISTSDRTHGLTMCIHWLSHMKVEDQSFYHDRLKLDDLDTRFDEICQKLVSLHLESKNMILAIRTAKKIRNSWGRNMAFIKIFEQRMDQFADDFILCSSVTIKTYIKSTNHSLFNVDPLVSVIFEYLEEIIDLSTVS